MNPAKYVKAIYGALSALAGAYAVAAKDGAVDTADWVTIAVFTVVGFITVWSATNEPVPAPVKPAAFGLGHVE